MPSYLTLQKAAIPQRHAVARICLWLYPLVSLGLILNLVIYRLLGQSLPLVLIEFIIMLVASILLWTSDRNDTHSMGRVICASFGIVSLCGLAQFGPTIGVGMMCFSWLLAVQLFFNRVFLPVILAGIAFVSVAVLEMLGLTPIWIFDPSGIDWLRMWLVVVTIMGGGAWCFHQIQLSLSVALENEARAQEERLEIGRELGKAQRLESMGRLAAGVAHDFNNSLAILVTATDAIRSATNDEEREGFLRNIEHTIEGAVATSRQLLSVSKQGVDPGLPTSPKESLLPLIEALKRLLPENITINSSLECKGYIAIPSGELDQIVLNLCLNSRDAMIEGGELFIGCRNSGGRAIVEIKDTGEGMDSATRDKSLEPHFTTKGNGSGLGLSMVNRTVGKYQGSIAIDSDPNEGTTVTISFPCIEPEPPISNSVKQVPSRAEKTKPSRKTRILLLEDEQMLRELYQTILASKGYEVCCAATVAQALDVLKQQSFDIMISDAGLPDGDPSVAINLFRKTGVEPVIVCSGHVESKELINNLSHNEYHFLQKPFSVNKLIELLENI